MRYLKSFLTVASVLVMTASCANRAPIGVARVEPGMRADVTVADARNMVREARRFGAELHAPSLFSEAESHLAFAEDRAMDIETARYASLATERAYDAIAEAVQAGEQLFPVPHSAEASHAELDRQRSSLLGAVGNNLQARHPAVYGRLRAELALVRDLLEADGHQWREAARLLAQTGATLRVFVTGDRDAARAEPEAAVAPTAIDVPDDPPSLKTLYFDTGAHTLNARQLGYLEGVALTMEGLPGLGLRVAGHTDDTLGVAESLDLSRQRAEAVRDALVAEGVAPGRVTVTYHGKARPVADNTSREGRALNRRVEMTLEGGAAPR